jgi:large subunit ribosomal protein L27
MAHRKAGGTAHNLTDSQPKYLGTKLYDGERAQSGSVIIRQRGSRILAGKNVGTGKDYTLYAEKVGTVSYRSVRKTNFDGTTVRKKVVDVK